MGPRELSPPHAPTPPQLIRAGSGAAPTKGQNITVHCTGTVQASMKKFWSTKDPGQTPFSFKVGLGQVIRGWDESMAGMLVGEVSEVTITGDFAYGASGFPAFLSHT